MEFLMSHPSLGHCSFLPKFCLNSLKTIRFEDLADVQAALKQREQVMMPSRVVQLMMQK